LVRVKIYEDLANLGDQAQSLLPMVASTSFWFWHHPLKKKLKLEVRLQKKMTIFLDLKLVAYTNFEIT